jgi:hypothetical protein
MPQVKRNPIPTEMALADGTSLSDKGEGIGQECLKNKHKLRFGQNLDPETRRSVRRRIAQWYATPEAWREPRTRKALAKELGINPKTVAYHISRIPKTRKDFIKLCELQALSYYPEACLALARRAATGDMKAIETFLTEIVKPPRPQSRRKRPGMIGQMISRIYLRKYSNAFPPTTGVRSHGPSLSPILIRVYPLPKQRPTIPRTRRRSLLGRELLGHFEQLVKRATKASL